MSIEQPPATTVSPEGQIKDGLADGEQSPKASIPPSFSLPVILSLPSLFNINRSQSPTDSQSHNQGSGVDSSVTFKPRNLVDSTVAASQVSRSENMNSRTETMNQFLSNIPLTLNAETSPLHMIVSEEPKLSSIVEQVSTQVGPLEKQGQTEALASVPTQTVSQKMVEEEKFNQTAKSDSEPLLQIPDRDVKATVPSLQSGVKETLVPAPSSNRSPLASTEKVVSQLLDRLSELLEHNPPSLSNTIQIVTTAMELVETERGLSGEDKKTLVIELVDGYIARSAGLSETEKSLLDAFSQKIVSQVIDAIIASSKGEYKVNGSKLRAVMEKVKTFFCACKTH